MKIEGSFIQPFARVNKQKTQLDWDASQWVKELGYMKAIGMDLIIIQFAAYERQAYFPSKLFPQAGKQDQLENILSQAQVLGMKVMVGLCLDNEWWKGVDSKDYFFKELDINKKMADELWEKYGHYTSFWGWYIPHEIDDMGARPEHIREMIAGLLLDMGNHLRTLSPGKPVGIAPYYGMHMTPAEFEEWWYKTLNTAKMDIMMLQDGVGCHRPDIEKDITPYYAAMQKACQRTGTEFWSDLEVFDQVCCPPIDDTPLELWEANPASIERIKRQIELEAPYLSKIVCFAFTHYMSPQVSVKEEKLYRDYQAYLLDLGEVD